MAVDGGEENRRTFLRGVKVQSQQRSPEREPWSTQMSASTALLIAVWWGHVRSSWLGSSDTAVPGLGVLGGSAACRLSSYLLAKREFVVLLINRLQRLSVLKEKPLEELVAQLAWCENVID